MSLRHRHTPRSLHCAMNPHGLREGIRQYVRGPIRDTAWIALGAAGTATCLVTLLAAWPR